ncbi:PHA/PHB synthase family protein [Thioalbus denitrificans]|uniref:Polyhydroxyalkanoate synthase n=1 Tax=Thioalbus denitrificans TaxID=547122 RepID=A0A369CGF2_9GAMM|nr:class I poly(R)-hydroxyalkanoic acid synthase [Thioalbus denitrificans]RCX32328.1 polyhydroxyalkanoate synthase [Thioalbus denitrificans]
MSEQTAGAQSAPNPIELSQNLMRMSLLSQQFYGKWLSQQLQQRKTLPMDDSLGLGRAFSQLAMSLAANPAALAGTQVSFWQDAFSLWQQAGMRMLGASSESVIQPARDDRRFKDEAWQDNPLFDFIKQAYLLTAKWMLAVVRGAEGLEPQTARKVDFFTRQFLDALAPTNFLATNPEVLRTTLESNGGNLVRGMEHLLNDLQDGQLRTRMTDLEAFTLGQNIAVTPGKVVFQNELMQLLQYTPTTEKVRKRPLLIVPPWINKFYILDLREKNSFIRWAVAQGHTVFVISWVNPDARLAEKNFDDYLTEGPLAALDAIEKATGERQVNAVGYCLGGTLLASTLAWLAARRSKRIASATFLTTMLDFSDPGELGVFIDEDQLVALEERMDAAGYLDGRAMATTFNMLRANDLIWSFAINNYLLGKEPFPFDLLYWNSDSTRMPARMHSFYLRKMYQENLLKEPGALKLAGSRIDLGRVQVPVYFLSTREDHIAPWQATYRGTRLFSGPVRFVLGASGHIAGVINPPVANKYGYWTGTELPEESDAWLEGAERHDGSWWSDWDGWVGEFAAGEVEAREPGKGLAVLEDAPGSYVAVRAGD